MIAPSGPCPARIMIVGEFPGEQELAQNQPFVGYSGQELSRILHEAGIMRSSCFMTYAIRTRPPGNDLGQFIAERKTDISASHVRMREKFVMPAVVEGLSRLKREIEMCQPHVIIALGNAAMWLLTGRSGMTSWRGSVLQTDLSLALDYQPKVIPSFSAGMVMNVWSWRPILIHDLRRAKKEAEFREIFRPEYKFVLRPDFGQAHAVLSQLLKRLDLGELKLSIDIETRAGHIACIGVAWSKLEALCIPLMCVERPAGYWTLEEEVPLMWLLHRVLTHRNCRGVGQNFAYDTQYFQRHLAYHPRLAVDTMISQHTMFGNMQKGLDFLSSMYCEFHEYWKDEGKEWDPKKHDEDSYWGYNCKDAVITYEVDDAEAAAQRAMLPSWPKLPAIHKFQQDLFWPVLESMERGVRIDTKLRTQYALTLMEEISKREAWLFNVLGEEINIGSPLQMKVLFYETLGQKPVLNRKTRAASCDDEALRTIAGREPLLLPVVRKIAEMRSLGKFLSSYVNAPLDVDGRMRCSFNITGTETYRFASKKNAFGTGTNLQNIPKGGEVEGDGEELALELPNIRSLFVPDPGHTFFDIDLDSADLRIVAWEADIQEMMAMLDEGKKVYVEVMKEYYHNPAMTKHDRQYGTFKSLCHGTHYLGSAKGLAERLGLLVHEVDKLQKWYYGKFPNLKKWQDEIKDQVLKRRMVENVFGYRCYFFDRIEGTIFNQAIAWIPQSTVGCLINRAYDNLYQNHKDIQVLLQVHDSLAGQFPTHLGNSATERILDSAKVVLPYQNAPLIIPVGIKTSERSWGDCG